MTYNTAPRRSLTKKQRDEMLARAGNRCIYCKGSIGPNEPWQDCHIIAREMGGSDDLSNRGPGHVECHKEDTRNVAKAIAKSNRIRRANGPVELRKKKRKIKSRGFAKGPVRKMPSRPFQQRR